MNSVNSIPSHLLPSVYSFLSRKWLVVLPVVGLSLTAPVQAATDTWTGTSSGSFGTGSNWGGTVPNQTGDSLAFTSATGAGGTTLTDNYFLRASSSVAGITFGTGSAAFTINAGTVGTNGFTLTGGITNNSASLETINDAIGLSGTDILTTTSGGGNLALGGVISGTGALTTAGTGTVTLTGANTYTGATTVTNGTLSLNFSATGAPATNIINNTANSSALAMSGGTLLLTGKASTTNSQRFNGTTFNAGGSAITLSANATSNPLSLNLGAVSRNAGATAVFTLPSGTQSATNGIVTTTSNTNGLLGSGSGWAVVSNSGSATNGGTGGYTFATASGGNIVSYTGATAAATSTSTWGGIPASGNGTINYDLSAAGFGATAALQGSPRNVNTIRYTGTGFQQESNQTTTIQANAIMNAGTGFLLIGGGGNALNVEAGSTNELILAAETSGISLFNGIVDNGSPSALTVMGAGGNIVLLSGTDSYTGVTTVSSGTLEFGQESALYNGNTANWTAANLVVSSGATAAFTVGTNAPQFTSSDLTTLLALGTATGGFRNGSFVGIDTSNTAFSYAGNIANTNGGANVLGLTKTGSGTLTLSGANSYTGATTVSNGVINLTGTLNGSNVTTSNAASIVETSTGVIAGLGTTFTQGSTGTTTLAGANTYTGGTSINSGVLALGSSGAIGTSGTISFGGGILRYGSNNATDYSSRFSTAASQAYSIDTNGQSITLGSNLASSGGSLTVADSTGTGALTLTGNNSGLTGTSTTSNGLTFNASLILNTGSSVVLGSSTAAGAGYIYFEAANSVLNVGSGGYTISNQMTFGNGINGTITGSSNFTDSGLLVLSGGSPVITVNNSGTTTFSGSVHANDTNTTARTLGFAGTGAIVISGAYSNGTGGAAGGLTYQGSNTLTLSGANTYSGKTTASSGTIQIGNGTSGNLLNTGSFSALTFGGTSTVNFDEVAGSSQNMGALAATAGEDTLQSTFVGTSATVTFSSLATRTAGATLNFVTSGGTNGSTNSVVLTGVTQGLVGTGYFFGGSNYAYENTTGGYVRGVNYGVDSGSATATGSNSIINGAASNIELTGNVTGQGSAQITTLNMQSNSLTLGTSGVLTTNGILESGGTATLSGGAGAQVQAASGAELVVRTNLATDSLTISTPIVANGSNALTKSGAGTLTLSGANTYTGVTTINAGTLDFGTETSLYNDTSASWTAANIKVGSGATAAFGVGGASGFSTTDVSTLLTNLDGSVTTGGLQAGSAIGFDTTNATGTFAVSNAIANTTGTGGGTVGLTKLGTGTLQLSGANTYTGATAVTGGTLTVSGSTASGSAVTVGGVNGGLSAAILSGTGTIGGPVTTSSANSNVGQLAAGSGGGTTVGTLTIGGALTIGTGTALDVALNTATTAGGTSNGLIAMSGGTLTIGSTLTFNIDALSALTTSTNSGASNFYTIINGAGGLSGTSLSSLTPVFNLTGTGVSGLTGHVVTSGNGNNLEIYFTSSVTGTSYTVATTPATTLLHQGETTTLTTTITNTGGSSADKLNYTGLGATSSLSNGLSPTATSSTTGVANSGGTAANAQTYTATNVGVDNVTNTSVGGTNHTSGSTITSSGNTAATVTVYSGKMIWAGASGGTYATNTNWNDSLNSGVHAAPGLDAGYQSSDTATFDTTGGGGTVDLVNVSPSLKAVTFNDATSYNLTTSGTGTLQLNGTGSGLGTSGNAALVTVTTGTQTISAPVSLTTDANIAVASVTTGTITMPQQLTVSGQISGSGGLNLTGTGTTIVNSSTGNTYTGPTTESAGTFYNNTTLGNATTHAGAITVSGGQFAGSGTITAGTTSTTGITVNNGGSLASGAAQSSTSGQVDGTHLTLNNTLLTVGSSFLSGSANLTFDLGAGNSGINGGNASFHSFDNPNNNTTYLSLTGSSSINFGGTTSISLVDLTNLNGTGAGTLALRLGTPYLLIHAGSNADYSNLVVNIGTVANPIYTLSQFDAGSNGYVAGVYTGGLTNPTSSQILGNISTITFSQFGSDGVTPLASTSTGIYPVPFLYLDGGNLEVVPEPGTWALMIGGLALLIVIQRRRNQER